jgi:elongation factor G
MKIEILKAEEYHGDVIGYLNRRRGQIQTVENKGMLANIMAFVRLEIKIDYVTDLHSLTKY